MEHLSHAQLKDALHYDALTGVFTWLKPTSNRVKAGARADNVGNMGYVRVGIKSKRYLAHRLAWFYTHGVWPENEIDHINRNRQDNRLANLRCATSKENKRNTGVRSNNSSGITGVSWDKRRSLWRAQTRINNEKVYLGIFKTKEEAATAYQQAIVIC